MAQRPGPQAVEHGLRLHEDPVGMRQQQAREHLSPDRAADVEPDPPHGRHARLAACGKPQMVLRQRIRHPVAKRHAGTARGQPTQHAEHGLVTHDHDIAVRAAQREEAPLQEQIGNRCGQARMRSAVVRGAAGPVNGRASRRIGRQRQQVDLHPQRG